MNISELSVRCHEDCKKLGWYEEGKTKSDVEMLMMAVTEISEAVEELRKPNLANKYYGPDGKPEGFGVELADTIIRLLDLCAYKNIPIEEIILEKLDFNLTRGFRHGNKLF